ncbi:uncharacterized protein LOC127813346 [Diospyros lotus]|uniref:uncharacterized protein LOC127813346 n=1 Tax=Diospyros lotus TaxID=55363 RepID=UPI0022597415|nr:uncharacterized protein LOC127813346 [Diospyros lotus]
MKLLNFLPWLGEPNHQDEMVQLASKVRQKKLFLIHLTTPYICTMQVRLCLWSAKFYRAMAETVTVTPDRGSRKQPRQPVSVPFLWEEKPGTPKKDWKPSTRTANPVTPPPVKLVASVPFEWEEKPGKPFPSFSKPQPESEFHLPQEKLDAIESYLVRSRDIHDDDDNDNDNGQGSFGDDNRSVDKIYGINPESDLEACGFETDQSFCSAQSLEANGLISTVAVSSAVPALQSSSMENETESAPSSPASETDSSTSSYATGTRSLVGTSFLEHLFPLLLPHSSFLDKHGSSEKRTHTQVEVLKKYFDGESNRSVAVRRPFTLGELIMMSRKRSNQRKVVQMQMQNLSMVILELFITCVD